MPGMFDAAPTTPSHALQQDPAFAAALRMCGQNPVSLPGGLILLHRRLMHVPVAMLPRAMPPPDLEAQLQAVGMARTPLILSPDQPCSGLRALRIRAAMSSAVIDLTPDDATRRSLLHPKWRNQLRRAEESPLRITSTSLSPDHDLLQIEAEQARARGYAHWPLALTAAFARVAPAQTRLFMAYLKGHPVAYMLFLRHGSRATYHIGHNTHQGRIHHAHNLLLWNASCWLAALGHSSLDLGLLQADAPTLNRFKLRAGAVPLQTGGTWLRWRPLARRRRP